ncbi:MFS general substrate transporter [Metschnikowia bicuspidata var. bicuspidata NRRL YB-4993]|uniref:MFS general substrate transporter n=1 Tax=Metschnikowia bicuspidata var. bicuspidata NRRL YB-4993 TaxID=869754 RepID=A0A1A0HC16_9ASCO|nr:MFS general substrate transporter [Metschnikowia bicuspidata var. bicuspidata NRRL YB-4993]OBA21433.1 MFS general substrate transporter [Metschnikowia bicuspidata var. bicuspidata NRRL YB-4993]
MAFDEENDGLLPVTAPHMAPKKQAAKTVVLPRKDYLNFVVLILLYTLQGVPVGLAFGSVPFILKSKLSYSQVGVFSLASYPYSLKLLWSPIVDAIYSKNIGRRKSWILPVQLVSGLTLLYLGLVIDKFMADPASHLQTITFCFFLLVFLCATQDIAVDGWALTCLSPESLSFASTAQTIGMNCGYFSSFTVFLALSSPEFANKYLRSTPLEEGLFDLGSYLSFWGWMYLIVTVVMFFIPEEPSHLRTRNSEKHSMEHYKNEDHHNRYTALAPKYWQELKTVYVSMIAVFKLPNVQTLMVILLLAKLGFQVNEAATNLKLLEKGLTKEDLSITVLIDFPFEMIFGYYAGRWSSGKSPLKPWLIGFAGRLFAALWAHLILYYFPKIENGEVPYRLFLVIIVQHLLGSFMSTIQFVSLCAFHTRIADPAIGGTYLTALNTLSNYGGTWPKLIIFYLIDKFTLATCHVQSTTTVYPIYSDEEKQSCLATGASVHIVRDGYFYTSTICISLGVLIWFWAKRRVMHLQALPQSAWRVNKA